MIAAGLAIAIIFAACGQNASRRNLNGREPGQAAPADNEQAQDERFIELLKEIYAKLPASVMPDYLKTEAQRDEDDVFNEYTVNYIGTAQSQDDGYDSWNMAAYPTEDNRDVVLIVQFGSGLDGFTLKSDKTLNYNIETGAFTEINRPIDPFTADELIDETHFSSPKLAAKAKAFFNKNKQTVRYSDFDKDGFRIRADLFGYDDDDQYGIQNRVISSRKWNGRRFVTGTRWHLNEDAEEIPYKD